MYSCVAPGPPCSSSTLMRGLLPVRFVHTLHVPFAVVIGIRFTPPDKTSSRPVLSKYEAGEDALEASEGEEDAGLGFVPPCASRATRRVADNVFTAPPSHLPGVTAIQPDPERPQISPTVRDRSNRRCAQLFVPMLIQEFSTKIFVEAPVGIVAQDPLEPC